MLFTIGVKAQQPSQKSIGGISGRVVDSVSRQSLEYVTIGLVTEDGDKIVNGVTSDDKGMFSIENIPEGIYKLSFYFIGYQTAVRHHITISASRPRVALGDIQLANKQAVLGEVTVTTEKSLIENKIDKMVYNAEKDLTSQGGVASDILKKIPQVSVDVNGNIELQGNSNIRFLINGKPSSMFGNNIADVLQSIPASQIQSIEVVTSPGARYDAEGGGIINIILKKNSSQGYNGNVSLTAGSRLENGSLNLAARKGKFGVNLFASGNAQLLSTTLSNGDRVSTDEFQNSSTLTQNGKSNFDRGGYQAGIGFDWELSPKDKLNATFNYNYFENNTTGATSRSILTQDASGNTLSNDNSSVEADNRFNSSAMDWSLSYTRNFRQEGQELSFLYSTSLGNNLTYYRQLQTAVPAGFAEAGSYGNNPGKDQQTNIALNYAQPLGKSITLETGAKAVLNYVSSNSDVYLLNTGSDLYNYNTSQSSRLSYNRSIGAAYISATGKLFNLLDVKAGCRYEYTQTGASYSGVGDVSISPYSILVPSGAVSYAFKNNQTLKLNYSRRISRPGYRDLNPFLNASDPKNITTGDPTLKPETTQNLELSYSKYFKKGSNITLTAFYRPNYNDIQPYTVFYPSFMVGDSTYTNVSVSRRANIGREDNFGLNLFASIALASKLSFRTNVALYQRNIYSIYPDGSVSGFMYRVNATITYQFSKSLAAELFGNFNSPRINAQGVQPSFTTYNFAIRKFIFNKKGSIAFTATNPFNKYVAQDTRLTGTNFTSRNNLQLPYRSFGINFTYKFGRMESKKTKEAEDTNLTNPTAPGNP